MRQRRLVALGLALLLSVPITYASHRIAGNPDTVVTGHTALASGIIVQLERPTDFAAIAGLAVARIARHECVVWFNGVAIFDGTLTDINSQGGENLSFNEVTTNAADPCGKVAEVATLVAAVENRDCNPFSRHYSEKIVNATFVRDLSFDDPNGITHPVAEVKYTCLDGGGPAAGTGKPQDDYAWVTMTHATVIDATLDDGVCATLVRDNSRSPPFAEHNFCSYNFALIVDTCNGPPQPGDNGRQTPASAGDDDDDGLFANLGIGFGQGADVTPTTGTRCTDGGGEEFLQEDENGDGDPTNDTDDQYAEKRFDGSRRLHDHAKEPTNRDQIRDGNSNPDPIGCNNPDDHREDKSVESGDPCDASGAGETDYDLEEDHLAAAVDLYVVDVDCGDPTPSKLLVARRFCEAFLGSALSPLVVNHPGCVTSDNATIGGPAPGDPTVSCWDPPMPPNDLGNRR